MHEVVADLVWGSTLRNPGDRLLLLFVARHTSPERPELDLSEFSVNDVARNIGVGRRAAFVALRRLREAGLLCEVSPRRVLVNTSALMRCQAQAVNRPRRDVFKRIGFACIGVEGEG